MPRHLQTVPPPSRAPAVATTPARDGWATIAGVVAQLDSADHGDPSAMVSVPVHELVQLHRKLQTQPVIEEANGILMGYYGLNADTAFTLLRRWSQHSNIKVRTLAQALVDAVARQPSSAVPPHDLIEQLERIHARGPSDG